jgi:DNA polymerase alpha subunit B
VRVQVVEGVTVINPGTLSKRKGAGTYSQMSLQPRVLSDEEKAEKSVLHKVYERARVDVVRI